MESAETNRDLAAQPLHTKLLQRIARTHQNVIAEHMGWSTTTMNRVVSGETGVRLHELEKFLAAIDLVATEVGCEGVTTVSVERLRALETLAREALS